MSVVDADVERSVSFETASRTRMRTTAARRHYLTRPTQRYESPTKIALPLPMVAYRPHLHRKTAAGSSSG